MVRISDEFAPIFDKLGEMRSYMLLLEQENRTLRELVRRMTEHAMLIAEEGERGEPIVPLNGTQLGLIDPSLRDDLSLKLAVVEKQAATSQPSKPDNGVTPDWLVAAMPTQQLPHDTLKLENSYVLSKE